MNQNTIEAGGIAVDFYIAKRITEGCTCRKATKREDMFLGFDVVVVKPDGIVELVDVKNRSHNICCRLMLDSWKFYGRKPFAAGTMATHIYIADEDVQVTLLDYYNSFVFEYENVHMIQQIITELQFVDFKPYFQTYNEKRLISFLMGYKNKFTKILRHPWEFKFDDMHVDYDKEGKKWFREYKSESGEKLIDRTADHLAFALIPSGKSNPQSIADAEVAGDHLTRLFEEVKNKNKKDVS